MTPQDFTKNECKAIAEALDAAQKRVSDEMTRSRARLYLNALRGELELYQALHERFKAEAP